MDRSPESKSINLSPVWQRFAHRYLLGVLLLPLLGLGAWLIWKTWKEQKARRYRITDRQISSIDVRYHQTLDLSNIEEVRLRQTGFQRWLGTGDLVLETGSSEMVMVGMENPASLKAAIEEAAATLREAMRQQEERKSPEPDREPGSMDRMDYLTGLWQQGLISDRDFNEERRHFE
ncbi:MAG: PH domain-containing protein [Balneolaceae bacterium]|nr:PH domain-containing protein [Balneolaceae bacterium]